MKEYINKAGSLVLISKMTNEYLGNAINYFARRLDEIREYKNSDDPWLEVIEEARDHEAGMKLASLELVHKKLLQALRKEFTRRKKLATKPRTNKQKLG